MFSIPLELERTTTIAKNISTVYATIGDFNLLPKWSPWLNIEPDSLREMKGKKGEIGHIQRWDGKLVGAGEMKIVSCVKDERIEFAARRCGRRRRCISMKFTITRRMKLRRLS